MNRDEKQVLSIQRTRTKNNGDKKILDSHVTNGKVMSKDMRTNPKEDNCLLSLYNSVKRKLTPQHMNTPVASRVDNPSFFETSYHFYGA